MPGLSERELRERFGGRQPLRQNFTDTPAETHFVPVEAIHTGRQSYALCGLSVVEREISSQPTCPDCAALLEKRERALFQLGTEPAQGTCLRCFTAYPWAELVTDAMGPICRTCRAQQHFSMETR